jgi:phosphoribosylaminoimidazole-succinocarboxamide synthase
MTLTPATGPLLYEGKAKRVYATDQDDLVAVEYKDDATAFNALKKAQLLGKGALNCRISALLFEHLERLGVPTHYRGLQGDHWMMVQRVRVVHTRLPRLATDQTASIMGVSVASNIDTLLPVVRQVSGTMAGA